MPIVGDLTALTKLGDKIRQLTTAGFARELSEALAVSAWQETQDGFEQSRDPYGAPWEPLKARKGKPLIDTGQMRQSVSVDATENGFRLRIGTTYAAIHQFGGHIAPHSRLKPATTWHNPKTGRLVSRSTKLKLVHEVVGRRATFGKGITIPARPMVPLKERGLGPIWTSAFNRVAYRLIRERLGKAA